MTPELLPVIFRAERTKDALYRLKNMPETRDDEVRAIDNFLALACEFKVALFDDIIRGKDA